MRGIGAPSIGLSLIVLIYVVALASFDLGGPAAVAGILIPFALIEAILFWITRDRNQT